MNNSMFQVVLNGHPVTKPVASQTKAINDCKKLLKKTTQDYKVVEVKVVYEVQNLINEEVSLAMEDVLEKYFLPLVMNSYLDPKVAAVAKKLSDMSDPAKVEKLLKSLKVKKSAKSKNKLVATLYNKCVKLTKQVISELDPEDSTPLFLLVDVASYLEIAQAIHNKNVIEAYNLVHDLDTGAREDLPNTVWKHFDY